MASQAEGNGSGTDHVRSLYERVESASAEALEQAVDKPSFGQLLAWSAENLAALTRIGADIADLTLRNLRIASRADVTRLARQLARSEDKLERVLQEVEALRDELGTRDAQASSDARDRGQQAEHAELGP